MSKPQKLMFLPGTYTLYDGVELPFIRNHFELVYFDGTEKVFQGYTKLSSTLSILKNFDYKKVFNLYHKSKGFYLINHEDNTCKHAKNIREAINLLDRMGGTLSLELSLYFL